METNIVHQNHAQKWGHRLLFKLLPILCILLYAGCAQVPKQSVELSATVGRDIAQVYKGHRELAVILYGRIKDDVNKFVDQVYAPYQVEKLLQADHEDFKKGDPNALFSALNAAIKEPKNPDAQKTALQAMDVFVQVVRAEIESYREERLAPVLAQEKELLSAIDRSYNQIHYANSIVTGHLASIVKVHDAQEDLLNEFGIEGLRKDIGQKLSSTSNSIAEFVKKAKRVDGTVEEMEEKIKKLTEKFDMLVGGKEKKEE
jgi:hypothetical protein